MADSEQEKTVRQAQKELGYAIDRETEKLHKAVKPYWNALDKAWSEVRKNR